MKQLNRLQSILFMTGGALMVIGAGCYVFMFQQAVVCQVFLVGAVMFAVLQMMQTYEGSDFVMRRLKRIMNIADLCFVFSGLVMVENVHRVLMPLFSTTIDYYNYLFNKWVPLLLIAAILEMYTMHRMSNELKRKTRND